LRSQIDHTHGFAILFGGFTNQSGVTLFDSDVPDDTVVRALLRDHRERASPIEA
jgi:hypothetical protein